MKKLPLAAIIGGTIALAQAANATPFTGSINFDEVAPGTVINTTYSGQGVTFVGEPAFSHDIATSDLTSASPNNSIDGTNGVIDVLFSPTMFPTGVSDFTFTSLPDPGGFSSSSTTFCYYEVGNANPFVSSAFDQTMQQIFTVTSGVGIDEIVLPADAFYDNITFHGDAVVPEPKQSALFWIGSASLLTLIWRQRRRAA